MWIYSKSLLTGISAIDFSDLYEIERKIKINYVITYRPKKASSILVEKAPPKEYPLKIQKSSILVQKPLAPPPP